MFFEIEAPMTVSTAVSRPRELLLLLLLATLWGSSYTLIRIGVETIPPITFIAARTAIAGTVLGLVLAHRGIRLPRDRATWGHIAVQAGLNSVAPFTLIAWAEQTIEAGPAVILNATTPIFAFLITATITRHERVDRWSAFGVAAGLGGIVLIVGGDAVAGIGREVVADLAIVAASICYAVAAIRGKRFRGLDPMVPAAGTLIVGTVALVPLAVVVERPWTITPSAASLAALVVLAVASTALAFTLYFRLIQTLGTVGTTAQAYLRVPIGVAIGAVFLGERLQPMAWIGLVAVVGSVVAMTAPRRAAPK
jgi:drug/metabolite transporter (DMT)-like permease